MSASHVGGPRSVRARTLVLGWGNDLRCDDAAGRRVADAVGAMRLPHVEVLTVHQLVPEHVEELAGRSLVVFVDAAVDVEAVAVRPLQPVTATPHSTHASAPPPTGAARPSPTHAGTPQALLGLAATLGGAPDRAVLIAVPARCLGVGTALSPHAEAAVATAVDRVMHLVSGP